MTKGEKIRRTKSDRGQLWLPGRRPWNKGKKGLRLSPATEFKKGFRPTHALPLGTVKLWSAAGGQPMWWIKVDERGPYPQRWMSMSHVVWLIEHRAAFVPRGLQIVHLDGDGLNDDPANLQAMNRAEARAHIYKLHPDLNRRRNEKARRATLKRHAVMREVRAEAQSIVAVATECASCGFEPTGKIPPDRCLKCGGRSWSRIRRPVAA